jgi:hypothetical protein
MGAHQRLVFVFGAILIATGAFDLLPLTSSLVAGSALTANWWTLVLGVIFLPVGAHLLASSGRRTAQ